MAYKNRCTEWTNKGKRCKNKIHKDYENYENYGKNMCYIHYIREKSAAIRIENWYLNSKSKLKKSVLKIENWYHKILSSKREAIKVIEIAWLNYKDEKCPICLENFKRDNIIKTDCGHRFCKSCLQNTFNSKINETNETFLTHLYVYNKLYHHRLKNILEKLSEFFCNKVKCPICRRNILDFDFYFEHPDAPLLNACIFKYRTDKYFTGRLMIEAQYLHGYCPEVYQIKIF